MGLSNAIPDWLGSARLKPTVLQLIAAQEWYRDLRVAGGKAHVPGLCWIVADHGASSLQRIIPLLEACVGESWSGQKQWKPVDPERYRAAYWSRRRRGNKA